MSSERAIQRPTDCPEDGLQFLEETYDEADDETYRFYRCPNCGYEYVHEHLDCPDCLWYSEEAWERTTVEGWP